MMVSIFRVTNQFEELEMVDDRMIYCLHGERSIEFSALKSPNTIDGEFPILREKGPPAKTPMKITGSFRHRFMRLFIWVVVSNIFYSIPTWGNDPI